MRTSLSVYIDSLFINLTKALLIGCAEGLNILLFKRELIPLGMCRQPFGDQHRLGDRASLGTPMSQNHHSP